MPKPPAAEQPAAAADRPWTVKLVSARARKEWERAAAAEPDLMAAVRERLRHRPLDRSDNPNRTHQLKGQLAQKWIGDVKLPQWQHEISSAGRVYYCPDREARVVWVTRVDLAHPRETD